jgi:hypothetical protein
VTSKDHALSRTDSNCSAFVAAISLSAQAEQQPSED